jgi:hypothetical protein
LFEIRVAPISRQQWAIRTSKTKLRLTLLSTSPSCSWSQLSVVPSASQDLLLLGLLLQE